MRISGVLTTYNRPLDLKLCLDSLLEQTSPLFEIVVVDNGVNRESEGVVAMVKEKFEERNIQFMYVKNMENSVAAARNIGARKSSGDLIFFIDDDFLLTPTYLEGILKTYQLYPSAMAVGGYIDFRQNVFISVKNFFARIFFLSHMRKQQCIQLPSLGVVYPYRLFEPIICEWLCGGNSVVKRTALDNFQFDENLKKYGAQEDVDFFCRIFKKYPQSLYITPWAVLFHKISKAGRLQPKELIFLKEVYSLYVFYKDFEQSFKNKIIYIWSRVGALILKIFSIISGIGGILELKYLLGAYIFCIKHRAELKRGNLDFFNSSLKNS